MAGEMASPLPPIVPFGARRGRYLPRVDSSLIITLPGEKVRASVCRVVSRDSLVCALTGPIMGTGRLHAYRAGETVAVERIIDELGQEAWRVISERALLARETAERLAREEAERRNLPIIPEEAEAPPAAAAVAPVPAEPTVPEKKKRVRRGKKAA